MRNPREQRPRQPSRRETTATIAFTAVAASASALSGTETFITTVQLNEKRPAQILVFERGAPSMERAANELSTHREIPFVGIRFKQEPDLRAAHEELSREELAFDTIRDVETDVIERVSNTRDTLAHPSTNPDITKIQQELLAISAEMEQRKSFLEKQYNQDPEVIKLQKQRQAWGLGLLTSGALTFLGVLQVATLLDLTAQAKRTKDIQRRYRFK